MKRSTFILLPLVFAALASPAVAQSRAWVPWGEIGTGPAPSTAPSRSAAPRPTAPARAASAGRSSNSGSVFAEPTSSPASGRFPAKLQGGAQPHISPSAPGQVPFSGYAAGSIVIDTAGRSLYYVTSGSSAYKYPISVGRDGFTWRGTQRVTSVQSWPTWRPPAEMRARQPELPEVMTGGINNPLGAKALYLGSTLYRIHGTNDTRSIGYAASSGCFRMTNSHVLHLATLARVGTTVHVLDSLPRRVASR